MASNPEPVPPSAGQEASVSILDMISKQTNLDKMMVLMEFLKAYDLEINIAGEKKNVNTQELLTELPNVKYTKEVTKNETWRWCVKQVYHYESIDTEKIVGAMDKEFMLKMIPHKRKREQSIINGLKNDLAGTEVLPEKNRRKRFFGMV